MRPAVDTRRTDERSDQTRRTVSNHTERTISSGRHWRMKNNFSRTFTTAEPKISGPVSRVRIASWRLIHRHGTAFDSVIGLVILVSSIFVGVELQCELEEDTNCMYSCHVLEHVFMVIFLVELSIRILADGLDSWKNGWFRFDFALVLMGVLSEWVMGPIIKGSVHDGGHLFFDVLSMVLILRILRLTRLVRAFRLFEQFREMWKLANGLMRSFSTVTSAFTMTVLTIYMFACLGIELVTKNESLLGDPETAEVIRENFPTLPTTMLTLIQFANADSIASVYKPIVEKEWHLIIYFGMVWLIVTIKLMNLITAVIVDTAIEQASEDREAELHARRRKLKDLEPSIQNIYLALLDKAGTVKLSRSAFRSGLQDMQEGGMKDLPRELREILQTDQIVEVCDYLDADRSGEIDEAEFTDGVFNLMLQSVPIETTQMLQMLRAQHDTLKDIQKDISSSSTITTGIRGKHAADMTRTPGERSHQLTGHTNAAGASASD